MERVDVIKNFCDGANYFLVQYEEDFGKILQNKELSEINIEKNEIYRSIKNKNNSMLFVYKINATDTAHNLNPLQLLLQSLEEARAIEAVYPHIFNWIYDGLYIKAYAIIPSHDPKAHTTISRYGGTSNFYKILTQHLENIGKMKKGQSPDYNFSALHITIPEIELSIGSINKHTDTFSVSINIRESYKNILDASKNFINYSTEFKTLDMKYWAREINPDFIHEAKHIKIDKTIPYFEEIYNLYPLPIRRLMNLKHKGNYNRFLLSRFLLSIHSPKDAKFIYYAVLGDEEREHVKHGNCNTQWNYIRNNIDKYDCPSLKEISSFIRPEDPKLSHLLEPIQDWIDEQESDEK